MKKKSQSVERKPTKVGFRLGGDSLPYRVWTDRCFGDQFDIVSKDQMEMILWTCNLLSLPCYYFHVCCDTWEDSQRVFSLEQIDR